MFKKENNYYKRIVSSFLLTALVIVLSLILKLSGGSFYFNEVNYLQTAGVLTGGVFLISFVFGQIRNSKKIKTNDSDNLIRSEQHLRDVIDNLPVFVVVMDRNGVVLETNKTAVNIANLKFKDVVGKPLYETHWWSFSKESKNNIQKATQEASKGEELRYDTTIRSENNNLMSMDFSISPIKDKAGNIHYLVASGTDISYRIKVLRDNISLYREIKRQKKIVDNIISNIPGVVIQLSQKYNDDGFKVRFINSYAEKIFGYKIGECKNIPDLWLNIIDSNDRNRVLKELELIGKNQRSKTSEFRCINKFGKTVWVEARFSSILDEGGKPRIDGVITDISDRKKVEYIKDEFISIASHEIKTPLTTIRAFGQMLEKKLKVSKDNESIKYINKMDLYISRLNQVVNDFLDFSKIKSGKMEYHKELIDFDNLVSEVIDDMEVITETHQIKLNKYHKCQVVGDKTRLSQVLINLITNAIKYSPEAKRIVVNIKKENDQVVVSVKDFGMGIPKKSQKKIFSKFYRVKNPKQLNIEGFGLGLYISSEIIKRHNGKIWLESEESSGSTFYFSLPVEN